MRPQLFVLVLCAICGAGCVSSQKQLTKLLSKQGQQAIHTLRDKRKKKEKLPRGYSAQQWARSVDSTFQKIETKAKADGSSPKELAQRKWDFVQRLFQLSRDTKEPHARWAVLRRWMLTPPKDPRVPGLALELLQHDPFFEVRIYAFYVLVALKVQDQMLLQATRILIRDRNYFVRQSLLFRLYPRYLPLPRVGYPILEDCILYDTAPGGFRHTLTQKWQSPEQLLQKIRSHCLSTLERFRKLWPRRRRTLLQQLADQPGPLQREAKRLQRKAAPTGQAPTQ